jgi:hypothetical protein
MRTRKRQSGFTLIETGLATVIIGVGVVALIEAHGAFMRSNQWSTHAATATLMGNEIRELTRNFPRHDPVSGLVMAGSPAALVGWGSDGGEVTVLDFDDMDDFDDIQFGNGGQLPGPIDALGAVIPETLADGTVVVDNNGDPVPIPGWSQRVIVEKVLPTDLTQAVPDDFEQPGGAQPAIAVDEFPLRITVIVEYQGPFDPTPAAVNEVVWIVP